MILLRISCAFFLFFFFYQITPFTFQIRESTLSFWGCVTWLNLLVVSGWSQQPRVLELRSVTLYQAKTINCSSITTGTFFLFITGDKEHAIFNILLQAICLRNQPPLRCYCMAYPFWPNCNSRVEWFYQNTF